MNKRIDLTGRRFGRLLVISFHSSQNYISKWLCRCDCGMEKVINGGSLTTGKVVSCGCYRIETHTKHNMSYSPEYRTWAGIKSRCYNPKAPRYPNYGERGITVCDRWLESFDNFYADMGDRPSKDYSIERLDVNGNYEPSNCKWATRFEQQRNIRVQRNNSSGFTGVKWIERLHKYIAQIKVDRKLIHLGCFVSIDEAANARKEAERIYWNKN